MRFLYRALRWLELGTQNPQKLTVGAYPCDSPFSLEINVMIVSEKIAKKKKLQRMIDIRTVIR